VNPECPLCALIARGVHLAEDELAVAVADGFPVSEGHSLVMPRRHEADFFALTAPERVAILETAVRVEFLLRSRYRFDGVNLGLNNGTSAGQTVGHAHLHVIPRYEGDVADPRGGVRWILPERAAYWAWPAPPT
jgi:diadenosine tetraphosphate (Ap4A) HIT family hydrolase